MLEKLKENEKMQFTSLCEKQNIVGKLHLQLQNANLLLQKYILKQDTCNCKELVNLCHVGVLLGKDNLNHFLLLPVS